MPPSLGGISHAWDCDSLLGENKALVNYLQISLVEKHELQLESARGKLIYYISWTNLS